MKTKKLPHRKITRKGKRSIESSPTGVSSVVAKLQDRIMQELGARFATTLYDDIIRKIPKSSMSDACPGNCKGDCWGSCKGGCGNDCTGDCTITCEGDCSITCEGTCFGTCNGDCAVKLAADRSLPAESARDILLTLRSFRQILRQRGFPR